LGSFLSSVFSVASHQEIIFREIKFKKFELKSYKHFGFKKKGPQPGTLEYTKMVLSKTLESYLSTDFKNYTPEQLEAMSEAYEAKLNNKD